jgi:hypothetical protein
LASLRAPSLKSTRELSSKRHPRASSLGTRRTRLRAAEDLNGSCATAPPRPRRCGKMTAIAGQNVGWSSSVERVQAQAQGAEPLTWSTWTSRERRWFHAASAAMAGRVETDEARMIAPTLCSRDQPGSKISRDYAGLLDGAARSSTR